MSKRNTLQQLNTEQSQGVNVNNNKQNVLSARKQCTTHLQKPKTFYFQDQNNIQSYRTINANNLVNKQNESSLKKKVFTSAFQSKRISLTSTNQKPLYQKNGQEMINVSINNSINSFQYQNFKLNGNNRLSLDLHQFNLLNKQKKLNQKMEYQNKNAFSKDKQSQIPRDKIFSTYYVVTDQSNENSCQQQTVLQNKQNNMNNYPLSNKKNSNINNDQSIKKPISYQLQHQQIYDKIKNKYFVKSSSNFYNNSNNNVQLRQNINSTQNSNINPKESQITYQNQENNNNTEKNNFDENNSFFYKDDEESIKQPIVVNMIPVSPNKKQKPNSELNYFGNKNFQNNENEQFDQFYISVKRCETVANCEENQQINQVQVNRKIINKSLSGVKEKSIIENNIGKNTNNTRLSSKNKENENFPQNLNIQQQSSSILQQLKENMQTFVQNNFRTSLNVEQQCNCYIENENLKTYQKKQSCQKSYKWLNNLYAEKDLTYLEKVYEQINKESINIVEQSVIIQIEKDIYRTYPDFKYFQKDNQGQQSLKNVLISFAAYDPQIGYVQGINFIAAFFVFHSVEFIAFWLLANIFERFEMRDIYLPNLPGLNKHSLIIEKLMEQYDIELYNHFANNSINPQMYITPWLFSLFGMVIPLKYIDKFYDYLIQKGWIYFYKFALCLIKESKQEILEQDLMGTLAVICSKNNKINLNQYGDSIDWFDLIVKAYKINLNEKLIYDMIEQFNQEN